MATYNGDANNSPVSSASGAEPVSITTASKLADLSATLSGPATAADGSGFTEKITVKNAKPANAGNVLTTVVVPAGLTVTNTGGGQQVGDVVYSTASQIPAGGQATYTITVKVSARASGTALFAAGTASLANPDPNYANNVTGSTVRLGQAGMQGDAVRRVRNPLPANEGLAGYMRNLTRSHHATQRNIAPSRRARHGHASGHRTGASRLTKRPSPATAPPRGLSQAGARHDPSPTARLGADAPATPRHSKALPELTGRTRPPERTIITRPYPTK